jgi:hypothetical protein
LMYDPSPGGIAEAKTGISGSRSCTNIQTGVFAYEDIWNGINLTDRPIPRGYRRPGRRPHVPSSKPTMSKSRRASSPGSIGSGHRLYRLRRGTKRTRDPLPSRVRLLGGHICVGPSAVNRVFCNFIAVSRPPRIGRARLAQLSQLRSR